MAYGADTLSVEFSRYRGAIIAVLKDEGEGSLEIDLSASAPYCDPSLLSEAVMATMNGILMKDPYGYRERVVAEGNLDEPADLAIYYYTQCCFYTDITAFDRGASISTHYQGKYDFLVSVALIFKRAIKERYAALPESAPAVRLERGMVVPAAYISMMREAEMKGLLLDSRQSWSFTKGRGYCGFELTIDSAAGVEIVRPNGDTLEVVIPEGYYEVRHVTEKGATLSFKPAIKVDKRSAYLYQLALSYYKEIYAQPYTNKHDKFEYMGFTTYRPNHGIAHAMRKVYNLKSLLIKFSGHFNDPECNSLCEEALFHHHGVANQDSNLLNLLKIMVLGMTAGRDNELSRAQDVPAYESAKARSAELLKQLLTKHNSLLDETGYIGELAEIVQNASNPDYPKASMPAWQRFAWFTLSCAHELDYLARCVAGDASAKANRLWGSFKDFLVDTPAAREANLAAVQQAELFLGNTGISMDGTKGYYFQYRAVFTLASLDLRVCEAFLDKSNRINVEDERVAIEKLTKIARDLDPLLALEHLLRYLKLDVLPSEFKERYAQLDRDLFDPSAEKNFLFLLRQKCLKTLKHMLFARDYNPDEVALNFIAAGIPNKEEAYDLAYMGFRVDIHRVLSASIEKSLDLGVTVSWLYVSRLSLDECDLTVRDVDLTEYLRELPAEIFMLDGSDNDQHKVEFLRQLFCDSLVFQKKAFFAAIEHGKDKLVHVEKSALLHLCHQLWENNNFFSDSEEEEAPDGEMLYNQIMKALGRESELAKKKVARRALACMRAHVASAAESVAEMGVEESKS